MDPPKKILVVGEKQSGKTSIINAFNEYEPSNNSLTNCTLGDLSKKSSSPLTQAKKAQSPYSCVNRDFSLKILKINGKKVRVQLWDQGRNMNPSSTFQPLYIRHVSGCIVVARASCKKSLERAFRWKELFDKKTQTGDEPKVPCCIFINHDTEVTSEM